MVLQFLYLIWITQPAPLRTTYKDILTYSYKDLDDWLFSGAGRAFQDILKGADLAAVLSKYSWAFKNIKARHTAMSKAPTM